MLSLSSRNFVSYLQVRQFVTIYVHNKTSLKGQSLNPCRESKYLNVANPNLSAYRLFYTYHEDESISILPLMRLPKAFPKFQLLQLLNAYLYIRLFIDHNFKLLDVWKGAIQAIDVTLEALANRNYEKLQGLVQTRALKVLRHRVDKLTPTQQQMLCNVWDVQFSIPTSLIISQHPAMDMQRVQMQMYGCLIKMSPFDSSVCALFYCYTFERIYIDKIGDPWIIKIANHFSTLGYDLYLKSKK